MSHGLEFQVNEAKAAFAAWLKAAKVPLGQERSSYFVSQPGIRSPATRFIGLDDRAIATLIACAVKARENAYAPYSGYKVGAAVVAEDDRVFFGCNVENASYGLSLCAERTAIASAVAAGVKRIRAVVVVTDAEPPGTPCGACRQWMAELGDDSLSVVAANTNGAVRRFTLGELLPDAFRLNGAEG